MILNKKGFSFKSTLIAGIAAIGFSLPALAADPVTTSCDPDYMAAMSARALIEAQREIADNQTLIVKPDSVLEYSCFGSFVSGLAGAGLFSDSILGGGAITSAAASSLSGPLSDHFKNFGHTPLGGTSPSSSNKQPTSDITKLPCKSMESIWYTARCNIEADFHDFDWYANGDPRIYPVSMQACPAVPVSSATISTAYNGNSANYVLPHDAVSETFNPLATKDKYGSAADNVTTYLNKTLPVGSPLASGCAAPIMTGVEKDAICPNPGCFYNGSTCVKAGE